MGEHLVDIVLIVVAVLLAALLVFMVVENRRTTRDVCAALYVEHQMLLNAAVAQTPKDFGILKKLDREQPAPRKSDRPVFKNNAEYDAWIRDDLERMGLDPSALDDALAGADVQARPDADLPMRPHGL